MNRMEELYSLKLSNIAYILLSVTVLWSCFEIIMTSERKMWVRNLWKSLNLIGLLLGFYGILSYTVLNRIPSDNHLLVFAVQYNPEFYREMLMNLFLYFPFGICLSVFTGPWAIFVGFVLSFSVEFWQFFSGTGLAQGTDIIMNTIGCAIGSIPWFVKKVNSHVKSLQ